MTRRQFIRSVIAAGVVSFSGPLFPGPAGAGPMPHARATRLDTRATLPCPAAPAG